MSERYLPPVMGGRWAISREIDGRCVYLIQDASLLDLDDAMVVLRALKIAPTLVNLDRYFPMNAHRERCPTLELLELCNVLDETNPITKQDRSGQAGV